MRIMSMTSTILPLHKLRPLLAPAPLRLVHSRKRVEAKRVLGNGVSDALRVEQIRVVSQVVDVVALLVVVDIVRDAHLATEELSLGLGLETLGTGEETAGGDAVLDESGVVGSAAELGGNVADAVVVVEVLEVLLDDVGAGGAGEVEGVAVAVVDAVDVVGAGDLLMKFSLGSFEDCAGRKEEVGMTHHVKVEIGPNLGELG